MPKNWSGELAHAKTVPVIYLTLYLYGQSIFSAPEMFLALLTYWRNNYQARPQNVVVVKSFIWSLVTQWFFLCPVIIFL